MLPPVLDDEDEDIWQQIVLRATQLQAQQRNRELTVLVDGISKGVTAGVVNALARIFRRR